MASSWLGFASKRVIAIQILILGGLVGFFKVYLPHRGRDLTVHAAVMREQKINTLFHDSVVEDPLQEIAIPLNGVIAKRHPQRLRTTFSPQEAESTLGIPDGTAVDFRGGQHLTWLGTDHKLEACFNAGRLYCLILEERATGHGVMVFESPWSWHPY